MTTKSKYVDWGGLTPIVNGIRVNATKPGQIGTELTATEVLYLDGLTAGTAAASKAVVLDATLDVTGINDISMTGDLTVDGVAGTGAASAGVVTLTTPELTIVVTDQLGRIDFQAPLTTTGTDSILVAASIWAEAGDTFSASVNDTDLVFALGASEVAAEKARLTSGGVFSATDFAATGNITGGYKRTVVADGATINLTAAQSGGLCVWDKTDGATFVLPATAAGLYYDFVVTTASSSVGQVITLPASSFFVGSLNIVVTATGATTQDAANGTTHNVFTMNGTTQGGLAGSRLRVTAISSTVWHVEGDLNASGSLATPFTAV